MRLYGSFEKFGNYLLLDRMAAGGMAEVFVARPASSGANGRILIVKRILQSFTEDQESIDMFRAEVEICLGLNNPNIVQTYDFGYVDGKPYIAMEFIDGKSVRQIINKHKASNLPMHPGFAANIAAQAANGLHYAHAYKNKATGRELRIVHRDISPQNLVLSYDGTLKIIDFGIAKAVTDACNVALTRAGTIKGKVSYLSPEQASLLQLDGRSDIFSLGVVLWEMLTLEKLFSATGKTDAEIIFRIKTCGDWVRPPSDFNRDIPPLLDEIVLKALANSPAQRYQTGEELQAALLNYLLIHHSGYGPPHVSESLKLFFRTELAEEQKYLRVVNQRAQEALTHEIERPSPSELSEMESPSKTIHRPSTFERPGSFPVQQPSFTPTPGEILRPGAESIKPSQPEVRGTSLTGKHLSYGFPMTLLALGVVYLELDPIYLQIKELTGRSASRQVRYAVQQSPETAIAVTEPSPTAQGLPTPLLPAGMTSVPKVERAPAHSKPAHAPSSPGWILLRIKVAGTVPGPSRIIVNERLIPGNPAETWVRRDRDLKVRVENPRGFPFERRISPSVLRSNAASNGKLYTLNVQLKSRKRNHSR